MNVAFSGVATELKKSNLRRLGVRQVVNGIWTSDSKPQESQELLVTSRSPSHQTNDSSFSLGSAHRTVHKRGSSIILPCHLDQNGATEFPCQYFKFNNKTFTKLEIFRFSPKKSLPKKPWNRIQNGIASIPKINPSCTAGS